MLVVVANAYDCEPASRLDAGRHCKLVFLLFPTF